VVLENAATLFCFSTIQYRKARWQNQGEGRGFRPPRLRGDFNNEKNSAFVGWLVVIG